MLPGLSESSFTKKKKKRQIPVFAKYHLKMNELIAVYLTVSESFNNSQFCHEPILSIMCINSVLFKSTAVSKRCHCRETLYTTQSWLSHCGQNLFPPLSFRGSLIWRVSQHPNTEVALCCTFTLTAYSYTPGRV